MQRQELGPVLSKNFVIVRLLEEKALKKGSGRGKKAGSPETTTYFHHNAAVLKENVL